MTLIEAVVIIFVIAFLVMLLLPVLLSEQHHHGGQRISCVNNLKQLGLAYKIWAGDNNDHYPMEVSVTNGGTMELVGGPDAWKTFQVMSNELSIPKVIYCPEDSLRASYATNWGDDLKNKISYFIGVDATVTNGNSLLSGDDNFLVNGSPVKPGLVDMAFHASLGWDSSRHGAVTKLGWFSNVKIGSGNIGLADGSVQGLGNATLAAQLHQTGLATNRLAIP